MARPKLEDRPSKLNRSERPKRVSIHGFRDKLKVQGQEPGFHYCWVADYDVPTYERSDYECVTHDVIVGEKSINTAAQVGGKVTYPGGNGVTLFLMRIPEEYHQEDMDEYHQRIDESEAAMRDSLNSKTDGRYGGVEIGQNKPLGK